MFSFGLNGTLENDFNKVKLALASPHNAINHLTRDVIDNASIYASIKWGKAVDYYEICQTLGVSVNGKKEKE